MLMYVRVILGILAVITAVVGFDLPSSSAASGYLLNVSSEALGILLTVEIVDRLLRKQRSKDDAAKMAWRILHDIDYAVWVWHGGRREFDLGELLSILKASSDEHVLHRETRSLMSRLGTRSRNTLANDETLLRSHPILKAVLVELKRLEEHADHGDFPNRTTRDILLNAARSLAGFLRLSEEDESRSEWLIDPSPLEQEERWRRSW